MRGGDAGWRAPMGIVVIGGLALSTLLTLLLVPAGFAHGFVTLEPDTEVLYKVNAPYAPEHDRGVAFDDPAIGIDWGFAPETLILSDKDRRHPRLADLPRYFA